MRVEIDVGEAGEHSRVNLSVKKVALTDFDELQENRLPLPIELGEGQFHIAQLSNGASLTISECDLKREYRSRVEHDVPFVGLAFCLDGQVRLELSGLAMSPCLSSSEFCLFGAFESSLTRISPARLLTRTVVLKIPLEEFSRRLSGLNNMQCEVDIAASIAQRKSFALRRKMSADMALSLVSLCTCPFTGACRRLFLEGKYLELQSQALATLNPAEMRAQHGQSTTELEKLQRAREVIIRRLDDPPTLDDLAQMVGLSHTRLNRGFKREFGSTVFEYLREHRLDRARLLLEQSDVSVTQISHALGFASSSHFAQAFKAIYGLTPTSYRTTKTKFIN